MNMIVEKVRIFLTIMKTVGQYMPLQIFFAKKRTKSGTKFGQILYSIAYLVCVGIMIASDIFVYKGKGKAKPIVISYIFHPLN